MVAGLLFNRLTKLVHLPNVTGYLVAGLLIGPYVLRLISEDTVGSLSVISTVALGFIAFTIGNSFKLSNLKKLGASILLITFFEAFTALAFVIVILKLFRFPTALALTLGAIGCATAPAATLLVVRQYKAKGPVTNILLPVVALDDALGLISYSVCVSIAQSLEGAAELSLLQMIWNPIRQIGSSLAVGAVLGLVLALCMRFFHSRINRMMCVICAVFLGVSLADALGLSSLLLCMMESAVLSNLFDDSDTVYEACDRWTPPLFMLFFVISGAELKLSVLPTVGLLGVLYIVFRAAGKYTGAAIGSGLTHQAKNVVRYLGVTLIPQAGVAIGMSQLVVKDLPVYADRIRAVVLSATIVYELIGPLLTKVVLTKAGEITETNKRKKSKA